jgi:hypothetical protein
MLRGVVPGCVGEMQPHDNRDLFRTRKRDVVTQTAAQKGVGQLALGVACNDYD